MQMMLTPDFCSFDGVKFENDIFMRVYSITYARVCKSYPVQIGLY